MQTLWQLAWQNPLEVAAAVTSDYLTLLYSGARYNGCYSYLSIGAEEVISGSDIDILRKKLAQKPGRWHENFWVGWLGYGLKNQLEDLPKDDLNWVDTPDYYFVRPKTLLRFDHHAQMVVGYGAKPDFFEKPYAAYAPPEIATLNSNMTSEEYISHVERILADIRAGQYYQANLTRKYFGELKQDVDGLQMFRELAHLSPAAYSAYIKTPEVEVISSSPEQFLRIDASGHMQSRPIKGSQRRGATDEEDAALKSALEHSEKDRAENLMIVDLMRHDFSKVCEVGSVTVDQLFEVTTHPLIHHLSSTISGKLKADVSAVDAALACFPPGSMTGAPKIRAIQALSMFEKQARGIYSGAIGWFGGDGSAELSVVIRTIIKQGKKFEFQVGGGIVADSTPESELQETITKALGMCKVLGITPNQLI